MALAAAKILDSITSGSTERRNNFVTLNRTFYIFLTFEISIKF